MPRARIGICLKPKPLQAQGVNMNICGVDIHKSFLQIAVIDSRGNIVYQEKCRYSLIDIILLIAKLAKMRCREIAMESTGCFWIPLYYEFAGEGLKPFWQTLPQQSLLEARQICLMQLELLEDIGLEH